MALGHSRSDVERALRRIAALAVDVASVRPSTSEAVLASAEIAADLVNRRAA